jgi:PAS domain S-box-containing protein
MIGNSDPQDKATSSSTAARVAADRDRFLLQLANRPDVRRLLAGLGVLAAAIAISAAWFGVTVPYEQGRIATAAALDRTNDVIDTAMRISSGVRDAEAARQAYGLTGNAADRAVYERRMENMRQAVAALAGLTRDEPVQHDRLNRLEGLVAPETGFTGSPAADPIETQPLGGNRGPLALGEVSDTVGGIIRQQQQLLRTRVTVADDAERRRIMIVTAVSAMPLLTVALCATALGMVRVAAKAVKRDETERERLLSLIDLGAVIVRDLDGTIRFWSRGCEHLFGWTAAEAMGKASYELLRTDYPEPRAAIEDQLLHGGEWTGEQQHRGRSGEDVAVLARKILRRDAAGRPMILEILTDITALQRAEAALRKSRANLQSVVETAAECIIVSDSNGRITSINRAGLAMFGYAQDADLIGRDVGLLMPASEAARHGAYLAAHRAGAPPRIIGVPGREMSAVRRDGSVFPIDLSVSSFGTNGSRCFTGIVRDTTVRKAAEKALRDSEARLRLVQQVGEIANADWTTANARAFVSDEYHRLYGLAPGESAGTFEEWLGRVHPGDREQVAAEARVLNEKVHSIAIQFRIRRPDGAVRWIAVRAESFPESDGSLRVISGHQDITDIVAAREALAARRDELERQVAERTAALAEAEAQFRAVFDSQFQSVAVLSRGGTVLLANRTALLAGRRAAMDVVGRPFLETDWWPNIGREPLQGQINEAAGGALVRRDVQVEGAGGRSRWIDVSFKPVHDPISGEVSQIIAEWRDVTELRDLAEQLAQAQKVQALGLLAGGIAHDFNNILQSVSGAATLIERRPEDLARTRRLARSSIEAAARGASITQRLLSFARRGALRAEVIGTAELLNGMREVLTHTLGRAIAIRVAADNDVPPVLADRGQLETALVNLGTNARDAMPDGGTLTLSAEAGNAADADTLPASLAAGRYVRIRVADTGSGMTAGTFARLGEPFFTTKPLGSGTGLGLAMVKGFAEQSGGAMVVTTAVGAGTTVDLWLGQAMDDASLNRIDETGDRSARSAAVRIMLVDDDDLVRETLAEQMEELGFKTIMASSGSEALALIESGVALDALVSDLSMPGISGVATIQRVRALRPDLPCFLLTGYVGEQAALEAGVMFTLVHKPISGRTLAARIEASLDPVEC